MDKEKYRQILLNNIYIGAVCYHIAFLLGLLAVYWKLTPFSMLDLTWMLVYLYPPLMLAVLYTKKKKRISLSFSNRVFALLLIHFVVIFGVWSYFLGEVRAMSLITAFMALLFTGLYSSLRFSILFITAVTIAHLTSSYLYFSQYPTTLFWFREFLYLFAFVGTSIVVVFHVTLVAKKIREAASQDSLTQTLNRKFFLKRVQEEFSRSKRQSYPLSVLMIDIDHFKEINDELGHDMGDLCLVGLSNLLQRSLRKSDVICRWGGEEFMILLPDTDLQTAYMIANRLLNQANEMDIADAYNRKGLPFSGGVVSLNDFTKIEDAFKEVDELLYTAKEEGRNQIRTGSTMNFQGYNT